MHVKSKLFFHFEVKLKTSAPGQQQLSRLIYLFLKHCEALARHHISELLTLHSTSRFLRFAYQPLLSIPRTDLKPSFTVIGPKVWNGLPLRTSPSLVVYTNSSKTHVFPLNLFNLTFIYYLLASRETISFLIHSLLFIESMLHLLRHTVKVPEMWKGEAYVYLLWCSIEEAPVP